MERKSDPLRAFRTLKPPKIARGEVPYVLLCIGGKKTGKHSFVKRFSDKTFKFDESPRSERSLSVICEEQSSAPAQSMGFMSLISDQEALGNVVMRDRISNEERLEKLRCKLAKTRNSLHSTRYNHKGKEVSIIFKFMNHFRFNSAEENIHDTDGFLFFFSANDIESFSEAQCLLKLFEHLRKVPGKYSGVIIATKVDDPSVVVRRATIQNLAREFDLPFYMSSAKHNIGVEDAVEDVLEQINYFRYSLPVWKSTITVFRDKLSTSILSRNGRKILSMLGDGRDPAEKNRNGWAPIHTACWEGYKESVILFIQLNPSCVDVKSDTQWTPLHCAARSGQLEIVELLLHCGADILAKDDQDNTALSTSYYSTRELLEQYYAARVRNRTIRKRSQIDAIIEDAAQSVSLDMSFSRLIQFPDLSKHPHLREVRLVKNLISEIPSELSYLPNLRILSLCHNNIEYMPESLSQLTQLESLDVRCNKIVALNVSIGEMKSLKEILLGHNALSYLPTQLKELENTLETLDIYGNPLGSIPPDIIPRLGKLHPKKNKALFTYLESLSTGGEVEYNRVKVMFVGDGNVGKTSLMNCIMSHDKRNKPKKSSQVECTDTIATDGIDIHNVIVPLSEEKDMIWDCWDYAGQEIYYTTHQFFLSPRAVYLICYNLLDKTFSKIDYWLNSIHSRARGSPIFLVGTHLDDKEVTTEYLDEFHAELLQTIKPERFKSTLGVKSVCGVYSVGSRRRLGIKELMDGIMQEIIRSKFVGQLYPLTWIKLENTLAVLRERKLRPYIPFDEFQRICLGCQIEGESVEEVAKFLHQAGVICYFDKGNENLRQLVILDPQFLTKVMAAVVTIRHRFGQEKSTAGMLTPQDLPHIWRDYPTEMRNSLMQLLEQFEIAFSIPQNGFFVIPSLLPEQQPDINDHWHVYMNKETQGHVFGRTYQFEFLPLGFFPRLFIRNYHLPEFKVISQWRDGQLLQFRRITALFRYNPSNFTLRLLVHGPKASTNQNDYQDCIQVLRILLENIETTIEGWYETKVKISIPCSHCLCSGGYSTWEFPLNECMTNITKGKGYVLCRNVRKVRMDYLAPDLSFADLTKKFVRYENIEMGEVIGIGAFGTVCKGKLNEREVAIKQLTIRSNGDSSSQEGDSAYSHSPDIDPKSKEKFAEFQREVWIMSYLNHSCVCGLLGITMRPMAIIMDYLPLGDMFHLFEDIKKRPKAEQKIIHSLEFKLLVAFDIARGLEHLHSFLPPIIHRDVRSPNIFVCSLDTSAPSRVKVGDFGLSRLVVPSLHGGKFNLNWLAPEVMKSDQYNCKMDVYSFGIVMWEIMTLGKPFEEYDHTFSGKPDNMFKEAVIGGLRPSLPSGINKDYAKLMQRCWAGIQDLLTQYDIDYREIEDSNEETQSQRASLITSRTRSASSARHGSIDAAREVGIFYKRLTPSHEESVQALLPVLDGKFVWVATGDGRIVIWNTTTLDTVKHIKTTKARFYALCDAWESIWVASEDGTILVYNPKDYKKLYELKEHNGAPVRAMVPSTRVVRLKKGKEKVENVVFSGDADGYLCCWRVSRKKKPKLKVKIKLAEFIGALTLFKQHIVVGTEAPILLVDQLTLECTLVWKGHTSPVSCLTQFGNEIWSGSTDSTIRVWNENSSECVNCLTAHIGKVLSMTRSQHYVWSGSFDKTILIWDPTTKMLIQELKKLHSDGIRSMTSCGEHIWTGGSEFDGFICIWRCAV